MIKPPPVPIDEVDTKFNGSITMLAYGAGGTGKTEFGASAGKDSLFLSIGYGETTLSSPGYRSRNPVPPKIARIREEIDPISGMFKSPATAFNQVEDFTDWFIDSDFQTLTIDDATALGRFAKSRSLDISGAFKDNPDSLNKAKRYGFPVMHVDDYMREMGMIDWFLANALPLIKAKGKSFILTAHERLFYQKTGKIGDAPTLYRVTPGFTGQTFPDTIVAHFDLVWHFHVLNGKLFKMLTMPTQKYAAKTRWSGVFKEVEDSMTFLTLMKRMTMS